MHVKKGDKVKVISGKDKGKVGVIVRAIPKEDKIVIDGVAVVKRHIKGRSGHVGHIKERPSPIHVSNVALVKGVSADAKYKSALDGK